MTIEVVSAAIIYQARILLVQRSPHGSHPWKWVTAGGKVEEGESHTNALLREIREELGEHAYAEVVSCLPAVGTWRKLYIHELPSVTTGKVCRVTCYLIQSSRVVGFSPQWSEGIIGAGWFTAEQLAYLDLGPADAANRHVLMRALA